MIRNAFAVVKGRCAENTIFSRFFARLFTKARQDGLFAHVVPRREHGSSGLRPYAYTIMAA
jgi:hypothetical protein